MLTELAKSIYISKEKVQYDECCKKILANKHILARILKGTVKEYKNVAAEKIISYIENESEISIVPTEPGMENTPVINGIRNEDKVPGEGVIFYDICFRSLLPKQNGNVRVIINIEAQKNPNPGYSIITRGMFYAGRMLLAQLGKEFIIPHYDDLKKVFSIWICFNAPDKIGNAITSYRFSKEDLFGATDVDIREYDKIEVIQVCLNHKDSRQNGLTEMLNILFGTQEVQLKKDVLSERFDIPMDDGLGKEIQYMCNVSDFILEQGIEKGIEQGIETKEREIVESMIRKDMPDEMIMDVCGISQQKLDEIKNGLLVNV